MDNALRGLIIENMDRIYRFAYRRTGETYRAEDLSQEIILQIIRAWPNLRDTERVRAWMWGVARNVALRYEYKKTNIPLEDEGLNVLVDRLGVCMTGVSDSVIRSEEYAVLCRALACLAKDYRDILILYYLEEKSYMQIAHALSIPIVKNRRPIRARLFCAFIKREYR